MDANQSFFKHSVQLFLIALAGLWLLVGCQTPDEAALPTLLPTAAVLAETPAPVAEQLSENGLPITNTPPPETPTATLTPTIDPSLPTPTETPDYSIEPFVDITSLSKDRYPAGEEITLSGVASMRSDQDLIASLVTLDGRILLTETLDPPQFGTWSSSIPIPEELGGQFLFQAAVQNRLTLVDEDSEAEAEPESFELIAASDEELVTISTNTSLDRYLDIYRPASDSSPTAGYNFFFDGRAEQPVNFVVSIAILTENCQRSVSRQSFTLRGSGYWQGFVVIPENVSGAACAAAWFGEEGSEERREAFFQLDILANDSPDGASVLIASPQADEEITAGERLTVYGTASQPEGDTVQLALNFSDGTTIYTETVPTDRFGYWETEILLPVELAGDVQISVTNRSAQETVILKAVSS